MPEIPASAVARSLQFALRLEIGRALYMERMLPSLAKEARQAQRYAQWRNPNTVALLRDVAAHAGVELAEVTCPYVEVCINDLRGLISAGDALGARLSRAAIFVQTLALRNGRLDTILAIVEGSHSRAELRRLKARVERAKSNARYTFWLQSSLSWTMPPLAQYRKDGGESTSKARAAERSH